MKTTDKVLIGVLVILLVGMSGVMITAFGSGNIEDNFVSNKQLVVIDITPRNLNYEIVNGEEDHEDETEIAITGSALDRASAAALAYIGEGEVTDSEIGDEEGFYEIEITLDNGNEVDVHLDENFRVLSTEYENEEEDD